MFITIIKKVNLALLSVCLLLLIVGFFGSIIAIIFNLLSLKFVIYNYVNLLLMFGCSFGLHKVLNKS